MKLPRRTAWLLILLVTIAGTLAIPRISPDLEDVTIIEKGDNKLICEDEQEVWWYFEQHNRLSTALNVTPEISAEKFKSTLHFDTDYLSSGHVGFYYCVRTELLTEEKPAANTLLRLYETGQAARIYVYIDPDLPNIGLSVEKGPQFIEAALGEQFIVPCLPTHKDITVALTQNDEPVSGMKFIPTSGFQINNVRLNNAGEYVCDYQRDDNQFQQDITIHVARRNIKPHAPLIHTSSVHYGEGDSIVLNCSSRQSVVFSWELPDTSTAEKEHRVEMRDNNKTLIILKANPDTDAGNYKCVVTTPTQSLTNYDRVHITVYDAGVCQIDFKEPLDRITVNKSSTPRVQWIVEYDGHPKPLEVTWLDVQTNQLIPSHSADGKFEVYTTELSHGKAQSHFIVNDPVLADAGQYEMRVFSSEHCERRHTFTLNVNERPDVAINSTTVLANREVQIECFIVGFPESEIHWTWVQCPLGGPSTTEAWSIDRNCRQAAGLAINQDAFAKTYALNSKSQISTLTFTPTGPGQVTCSARNALSKDEPTFERTAVYVIGKEEPFVTQVSPDVISAGDEVIMDCFADRYNHSANMYWRFNEQIVESTADQQVFVTVETQQYMHRLRLRYVSVQEYQAGSYDCVAHLFNGEPQTLIQGLVVHKAIRPNFGGLHQVSAEVVQRQINEQLELSCIPHGMPVPEVVWRRDGVQLVNDERVQLDTQEADEDEDGLQLLNHTLLIRKLEISNTGNYECVASSRMGWAVQQYAVEVSGGGPSKTTIGLVIGLTLLLLLTIFVGIFFYRREHKKWLLLKHAGISYFDNGDMKNYNPDLSRTEQADLLPYDHKYEFPLEKLRLSGVKLGFGAFGVVYKAQALGIIPDVAETTVAVKTIKNTDKDEDIKALISELKIMIHMGKHVNVVNLLGAVTRDIRKRQLYVITEYCDLGNLYNFLKKNRNHFVNQVDHESNEINSEILTIQQHTHEYGWKYINIGHIGNNNHGLYSPKPFYVNDPREPDGPVTSTAYFHGNSGLNSDAPLLTADSVRASRRTMMSTYPTTANGGGGGYMNGTFHTVTTTDLVCWSFQVARGMSYLAQRGVLHGDLAARNILLCSDKVVKICDFGLSRSLRPEEDYQKESDGPLPIKWLAIESISHKIFNTSTDVWSFGIVLWEFFSLAQVPYADVPTEKMLQRLQDGHRMLRPRYATHSLYEIMRECWAAEPAHRPRFEQLSRRLGAMLDAEVAQEFIDLNDQYMQVNIEEGRGHGDYLSVLLQPDTEAPPVPFGVAPADISLATIEDGRADRVPESIPMLPQTFTNISPSAAAEQHRAMTPLARSDTDSDLDKQWRRSGGDLPPVSPRRLPPQNQYVNLPASRNGSPASGASAEAAARPDDAFSNPSYVIVDTHK